MPGRAERAKVVLEFIRNYRTQLGMAPTYREIGEGCGMKSKSSVSYWLDKLEEAGLIKRYAGLPRAIIPLELDEPLAKNS